MAEEIEDRYNAVHDVSAGVEPDHYIEGFCTYEVPDEDTARRMMEDWRQAYIDRVGGAAGVGPVCLVERKQACQIVPGYRDEPH